MNPLFKSLVIKRIREETPDFRSFELDTVGGEKITYRAGQYITLVHQGKLQEVRRSYSFTSAPQLNEPMAIGVKRIPNGAFSRWLFQLKEGDRLITSGSGGFFTLPEEINFPTTLIFLAAGAGITPIFSLIKTALAIFPLANLILIYSSPSPELTAFLPQLHTLRETNTNRLQITFLFSMDPDLSKTHLNPDLLNILLNRYEADRTASLFYICGPELYMLMCQFALRQQKVADSQIRKENFVTRKNERLLSAPPDTAPHQVTIIFREKAIVLDVQYPVSILETAKRAGIELPYSCETGKCGNCVARRISGSVWMSYNEVLTEKDIADGLTLTCTGYPIHGEATLEI